MRSSRRRLTYPRLIHFAAPAVFLLAVSIMVLVLRSSLAGDKTTQTGSGSTATTAPTITTGTTSTTGTTTIRNYRIKLGDTLGAIAIRYGVSVEDLLALNPGIDPTALYVGQKIKIGKAPESR